MPFKSISEKYGGVSPWAFRTVPALFGSLIPLLGYLLFLTLGASVPGAFLGGFALAVDNGFIVQARVIALDNQLIFFELVAVLAMFRAVRAGVRHWTILWAALAGLAAALAVGSKLTGLVSVSIPLFIWGVYLVKAGLRPNWRLITIPVWFFAAGGAVYLVVWYIHFALLYEPGFGDKFYKIRGNFFEDLFRFHYVMYERNANLTKTHSYSSPAISWPMMTRGIFYWRGGERVIYFLGNPVVWIGSTLTAITAIGVTILSRCANISTASMSAVRRPLIWIAIFAYMNSYLPYMTVTRDLFLYHYMPPLVFMIAVLILWFEKIGLIRNVGFRFQRRAYFGILGLIFMGFLLFSPSTYGWNAGAYTKALFSLFSNWR